MSVSDRINYSVLIALCIVFSTQSCTSISRQVHTLQLESNRKNPSILKLCNYGDVDVRFYQQLENLAKGHLFIDDGDEYGYYVIKYNTVQGHNSLCLQAKLYIFDSQGGLIKEYENAGYLKHIAVPHCGYNSQKKIVQKYSSLYEGIFEVAIYEASEINNALKKAGPINDKSEDVAGANIQSFFKDSGGAYKKHAGFHKNKVPQPQNNLPPQKQEKLGLGVLAGAFFYLIPLGLPTADAKISLEAQLYIFDSQGQLVKEYKEKDFFIQTAGLYYGHNPTKKVAKKYSNLYASFFEIANLQEDKINKKLLKSGPITKENEDVAKANIEAFFNGRKVSYAKVFEYTKQSHEIPERNVQNLTPLEVIILLSRTGPYETYYTAPQIETKKYKKPSSTSFDLTKLNGGLEAGTYYCTINNLRMKIALLFISLLDGDETVMGGTYRVSGNKLIASFYNGDTRTYIIEDSKNFHLEGTNEYWVHESIH